jgi:hypothetical protein
MSKKIDDPLLERLVDSIFNDTDVDWSDVAIPEQVDAARLHRLSVSYRANCGDSYQSLAVFYQDFAAEKYRLIRTLLDIES